MSKRAQRRRRAQIEAGRLALTRNAPLAPKALSVAPAQDGYSPAYLMAMANVGASKPPATTAEQRRSPFEPQKPVFDVPTVASPALAMDAYFDGPDNPFTGQGVYGPEHYALRYPELALLAQRPEYRRAVEVIATEMTRKGIEIHTTGDEGSKSGQVNALKQAFEKFRIVNLLKVVAMDDGLFGRGHIYVDLGELSDQELSTDIGNGVNAASLAKVREGKLKGFRTIEPMWVYPRAYNATNPLAPDWYRPQAWMVQSKQVHCSRLLTFVGREVPDVLKPAYMFGGLSLSQMMKPYVDNWLRTRQSVADLINAFSVMVLKTPMSNMLSAGGSDLIARLNAFSGMRDNRGLMAIDTNTEELSNVSAPLGGLDALQAQTQEHMAAVTGIPLVKLLGISPTGLNASSEGELRCFYDWVHAFQESLFRPNLTRILNLIQLHLFGKVDPEITFRFEPLWSMSEKEKAEVDKLKADTAQVLIDAGTLAPIEDRQRLADDPTSPYHGLDVDDVPDIAAEVEEGLEPAGRGAEHSILGRAEAVEEEDDDPSADRVMGLFDRARREREKDAA